MAANGSRKHRQLVEYVTRHLKQRFYDDIRAHAPGFSPPDPVENGHDLPGLAPDVTMVARGNQLHVMKVETRDTLKQADRPKQWQVLARHAETNGGRFWVVVPQGSSPAAVRTLQALELQAKVWEVDPNTV